MATHEIVAKEKAPTHRSTRAEKCPTVVPLPTPMNSRICFWMIRIGFCAFVEHLCTYALRRVLTVDDRKDIDAIVQNAKLKKSKLREVIRAVALSDLLRKR